MAGDLLYTGFRFPGLGAGQRGLIKAGAPPSGRAMAKAVRILLVLRTKGPG